MEITSEFLAHLVTIIGLPFAIATYIFEKKKEWKSAEEKLFDQLDEGYVSFLDKALAHTDLDLFGTPAEASYSPNKDQLIREEAMFGILISLFERCFLMFQNRSTRLRESQWHGWVKFMKSYCSRPSFSRVWNVIGDQFDTEFQGFLNNLNSETKES